jgi:hypothetical protein
VVFVMMPCILVGGYRHIERMCRHSLQGCGVDILFEMLVTTHKTTSGDDPDYNNLVQACIVL